MFVNGVSRTLKTFLNVMQSGSTPTVNYGLNNKLDIKFNIL